MGLFGPSKKEVWQQVADEINGDFIEGGLFKGARVEHRHRSFIIYLDTYTVSHGKSSTTYTRIRAPFINVKGLYLKIYRKGLFSDIGKALGMQDIETGDDFFDTEYIVKGNYEDEIKALLQSYELRELFERQRKMAIEIKDGEGLFGPSFSSEESELSFRCTGVIKDVEVLKDLFRLFAKLLDEFEMRGITRDETPQVRLYRD